MKIKHNKINFNVNTIAQLEALTEAEENDVCIVTDEDRGGTFVYRSVDVATNNGGTIFNGWCRQYDGAVNVKWFGAKGDSDLQDYGIGQDDTLAIQNAINSGESIFFPSGNYKISKSIIMPSSGLNGLKRSLKGNYTSSSHLSNSTNIIFTGTGSLLDFKNGDNSEIINTGFSIEGLGLYGSSSVPNTIAIDGYKLYGCSFVNCSFSRFGIGIKIESWSFYNKYENLSFKTLQNRGVVLLDNANGSSFYSCRFNQIDTDGNTGVGVCVEIGYTETLNFNGCWFERAQTAVLLSGKARGIHITQSYMEGCKYFIKSNTTESCSVNITDTYVYFYYNHSRFVLPITDTDLELTVNNSPIFRDHLATDTMVIVSYVGGGSNVKCQFINSAWDSVWTAGDLKQFPNKTYVQSNILGIVSQADNNPTGAIIEQGENSYGKYVKYADGTVVAYMTKTITSTINSAITGGYRDTAEHLIEYPTLFIEHPVCNFQVNNSALVWGRKKVTYNSTSLRLELFSVSSRTQADYIVDIILIGRWY